MTSGSGTDDLAALVAHMEAKGFKLAPARTAFRADASTAPKALPARNLWAIALTVTMATFMELLDTSISNVSLPHIAGGLGTSYDQTKALGPTRVKGVSVPVTCTKWPGWGPCERGFRSRHDGA